MAVGCLSAGYLFQTYGKPKFDFNRNPISRSMEGRGIMLYIYLYFFGGLAALGWVGHCLLHIPYR